MHHQSPQQELWEAGERERITAVASATPVVGEHAEVRRKERRQGGPGCTCGQCSCHQDERGSLTRLIFLNSYFSKRHDHI